MNEVLQEDHARTEAMARRVRISALTMSQEAGTGHPGADLSATDIICVLYGLVLRIPQDDPENPDRDRMVCSKSHAAGALYSALAETGRIPPTELATFGRSGSRLCVAVSARAPGVEASTGALGHGLAIGVGMALGAKIRGSRAKVYVLTGDGELQEGSNWEAMMLAASNALENLVLIVDRNRVQKGAGTEDTNALEPLEDKLSAFGWSVVSTDGHDVASLHRAIAVDRTVPRAPHCVIANTTKGRGVSFMEGNLAWHGRKITSRELDEATREIEEIAE